MSDITTYGECIAAVYDQWPSVPQNTDAIVAVWHVWPGLGRLWNWGLAPDALPCHWPSAAVRVQGIDASPAMAAQLRAKPGGEHIVVTMGDFADMTVEGRFIYNDWPVTILA